MVKIIVGLLAVLGLAFAAPSRETRQAGCMSAFQNVPNVCTIKNGQAFFPHPSDPTKFLQCDVYDRMYIIQCPLGEVFQSSTTSCQPAQQQTTLYPITFAPIPTTTQTPGFTFTTRPLATLPPATQQPAVGSNPCSAQAIARGQLYFPFPGDVTKFYECDSQGNPTVAVCPAFLQWDQTILSCVYPSNVSVTITGSGQAPNQLPAGQASNPCTAKAIADGHLFFGHPDNTKYIQCDQSGKAYINSCPSGLVWNAFLQTCYSPLASIPSGRK